MIIFLGFKRLLNKIFISMFSEDIYFPICLPNVLMKINEIAYEFVSKKINLISVLK